VCHVSNELKTMGGGTRILSTLRMVCETGRQPMSTRLMYWLFDHIEFMLPARTKSFHWRLNRH
jgi:hypothetical protein